MVARNFTNKAHNKKYSRTQSLDGNDFLQGSVVVKGRTSLDLFLFHLDVTLTLFNLDIDLSAQMKICEIWLLILIWPRCNGLDVCKDKTDRQAGRNKMSHRQTQLKTLPGQWHTETKNCRKWLPSPHTTFEMPTRSSVMTDNLITTK